MTIERQTDKREPGVRTPDERTRAERAPGEGRRAERAPEGRIPRRRAPDGPMPHRRAAVGPTPGGGRRGGSRLRIAILGAGPIGLEAALAAAERGWEFTVYEAGDSVGANV